jgi:hypothetical protein
MWNIGKCLIAEKKKVVIEYTNSWINSITSVQPLYLQTNLNEKKNTHYKKQLFFPIIMLFPKDISIIKIILFWLVLRVVIGNLLHRKRHSLVAWYLANSLQIWNEPDGQCMWNRKPNIMWWLIVPNPEEEWKRTNSAHWE